MVRLPRVVQQLDRREDLDVVYMISDYEWRYAVVSFYYKAPDPYPDTIMIVVVFGSVRLSDSVAKNLLVRRQIDECINDVFVRRRVRS